MSAKNAEKILMKGNEAIAEAAIRAGCTAYFGYPITPQNELIAYMAEHLFPLGRTFIQAESEVSAINMVFGAAATGARAMTSSSSPGISLKQEGLSYAAGADMPLVYVNMVRGGPGLGSIAAAQSDYFQSTRGGGHGDYRVIVLAPNSVQEAADLTYLAFDLADKWRMPALILGDGVIGQMMEAVTLPPMRELASLPDKTGWAVGHQAEQKRASRHITSLDLVPAELERKTAERFARYAKMAAEETRFEEISCDDAELVLVAYGTSARVSLGAVQAARKQGIKLGLFRPISLYPFPSDALMKIAARGTPLMSVEMSMGQMVDDIRLAVHDKVPVHLLPHSGGVIPTEEEVFEKAKKIMEGKK
jgi:2-oxoglutarate ferredoxin oxidoreductase subunit alpha